jgi:hypothetical protein
VSDPDDRSPDVVERSSQYFLTRDEDGFALWSVRSDDEEPVSTFSPDSDGEALARKAFKRETRMGTWATIFVVAAIISAIVWLTGELVLQGVQLFGVDRQADPFQRSVTGLQRVTAWAYAAGTIGNAVFTIAVGLSVVIWLHRRYRREG